MRKTRELLRQKWELCRTHREIAASVGQSLGAVAMTLGRAKVAGLDVTTCPRCGGHMIRQPLITHHLSLPPAISCSPAFLDSS